MREFSNKYLDLLTGKFAGINLTRIVNSDEFYNKQILDSVIPYQDSEVFQSRLKETKILIDVGFGGGFPLLPLSYLNKDFTFIGLEARRKKADVVGQIANDLEIKNVRTMHMRVEEVLFDLDVVITLKAVGKVEDFLSKINATKNCTVFFYKGPNFYELENLENILEDWKIVEEKSFNIPGTDQRYLIGFEKVPRRTSLKKNKKNLVKLSDFA